MIKRVLFLVFVLILGGCDSKEKERLRRENERLKEELEDEANQDSDDDVRSSDRVAEEPRYDVGVITGDKVYVRESSSTQADSKGLLVKGQRVSIIDDYVPEGNYDEAILRDATVFYDEYSMRLFTLTRGKAVKILENLDGVFRVSFKDDRTGKTGYAKISIADLEFISGDKWYLIKTDQGLSGWVFGKYVQRY